ncbi:Uncharacterised protein [Bartonella vinsonii]|uniref:Phage integrase n=1 Tax=Bartonella vinsonii TaxID=33047 RepID=A0A3S5F8N7_BARVI|nr:Uncharacterised protein [Bartonella vinsonii]
MPLMNRLNARAVATLGAGKYNDGAGLHLHKRKDGGAQWLYHYTIHGRRREDGLFTNWIGKGFLSFEVCEASQEQRV